MKTNIPSCDGKCRPFFHINSDYHKAIIHLKKVREHPDQFQAIFSVAKYYVFIFICDSNGMSYIH